MDERFTRLPRHLEERAKVVRLAADVPALVAHPEPGFDQPAPLVLWLHGRTAHKELDAGRYLRWIKAGIGACAIDLPGHGERALEGWDQPERTLDVLEQALGEIDAILDALTDDSGAFAGAFDRAGGRLAIGGMSAGGMIALRRLCDPRPHEFRCASVEGTTGALSRLYLEPEGGRRWPVRHDPEQVQRLDPLAHLDAFAPIPLLALHSEADELVPWPTQRTFLEALAEHYRRRGADPALIGVMTWPETGAPREHLGFGRFSNEAKNAQTEFLARWLNAEH
jgi:alpha-beta hydrolase superfamily lysophospholipase